MKKNILLAVNLILLVVITITIVVLFKDKVQNENVFIDNEVQDEVENDEEQLVDDNVVIENSDVVDNDDEPEVEIIELKPKNETTVKNTVKPTTKPTTNQIYDPDSSRKKASTSSVKNTAAQDDFVITIE